MAVVYPNGKSAAIFIFGNYQHGIARAMLKDAPAVIFDVATANVDPENEKELMEAIGELTHNKTVIMIAHRLKTVRSVVRPQAGRWVHDRVGKAGNKE